MYLLYFVFQVISMGSIRTCSVSLSTGDSLPSQIIFSWVITWTEASRAWSQSVSSWPTRSSTQRTSSYSAAIMSVPVLTGFTDSTMNVSQKLRFYFGNSYKCRQFLSISYWSNSEYWTEKGTQSGNVHSTELDVFAVKQSTLDLSLILSQQKQGRKYYALASSPSQLVRTGTLLNFHISFNHSSHNFY